MGAMRVTVGIPTYNRPELLRGAMESVLTQTFTDFTLLVSDNASEPETEAVVRSFDDERIRYVRADRNVGPTGNFRRVVQLADTEFVLILPDDDVLYPDHLRATVDVLDRFETVGMVHTAFVLLDGESRATGTHHPLEAETPVVIEPRAEALERLMVTDFPICFSSVLYRTEAIVAVDGLREAEGPFGDIQMWMRIALDWDFGYVADTLAGFRIHENTTTSGIGAEHGVTGAGAELDVLHARMRYERRTAFLDESSLASGYAARLRAAATLKLLAVRAAAGAPWTEVLTEQARVLRLYPPIARHRPFWRLVLAQLGGRSLNSALRSLRGGRWRVRR